MVRQEGLEPPNLAALDPKSSVSTISPLTQDSRIMTEMVPSLPTAAAEMVSSHYVTLIAQTLANHDPSEVSLVIHTPRLNVPEETRTPNLQIRSLMLYPIELREQIAPGHCRSQAAVGYLVVSLIGAKVENHSPTP